MKRILVSWAVVAILALSGCDQHNSASSKSSVEKQAVELKDRCVKEAKLSGFRQGNCAYPFIEACINTQSRKEMDYQLKFASENYMLTEGECKDFSSKYVEDFNKLDKF